MSVNQKLKSLYNKHWLAYLDAEGEIFDDPNRSGPLLLNIDEKKHAQSDFKIMLFGQETYGWHEYSSINDAMKGYSEFLKTDYNSVFWNVVSQLEEEIKALPGKSNLFLCWNNLIKVGKYDGAGFVGDEIYEILLKHFDVIQEELKIIKPDFLIFLTGPDYDVRLQRYIDEKSESTVTDFEEREFKTFTVNGIKSLRTYHPGYFNRIGRDKYISKIVSCVE